MKPKILKLSVIALLFLFVGASCEKDEITLADEAIEISSSPSITIYRTNKNYIDYVAVQRTEEGLLNAIPSFTLSDPRVKVDEKGNVKQNFRWHLINGYVVDKNASPRNIYTNITVAEYVNYNEKNGIAGWPDNLIEPRVIDENPYREMYVYKGLYKPSKFFTIGEINEMIESGTLETVFEKIK